MELLYASEIGDSTDWVGQNAHVILESVKKAGGWKKIFPTGIPMWLHKLRNYFNVEPKCLRLVDKAVTDHWMAAIRRHGHLGGLIKGPRTLSGDVYFDEEVEVWYQMGPGGSIYHWGKDPSWHAPLDAAHTHMFRGQTGIPIFKLICPDGTGGSKETIVTNPMTNRVKVVVPQGVAYEMRGKSKIGEVNETVAVGGRLVTTMKYQGSYNFAETAVMGLAQHEKYDVDTHKKDGNYVDPPNRFIPLEKRIFTESVLRKAGAKTKKAPRPISMDFDEPPMRRSPYGVSR